MAAGRELWLIFRARNQASAAIRSFANDMRAITEGPKNLQMQSDALALRGAALRNKMAQQTAQMESLISASGAKRLGVEASRLGIESRMIGVMAKQEALGLSSMRISIDRAKNEARIFDIEFKQEQALARMVAFERRTKITPAVGMPGRFRVGESQRLSPVDSRTVQRYQQMNHQLEMYGRQLKIAEMETATFAERQQILANAEEELSARMVQLNAEIARNTALGEENTAEAARRAAELRVTAGQLRLVTIQQQELNAAMAGQRGEALARVSAAARSAGRSMALYGTITLGVLGLLTKGYADFATEATTAATQITSTSGSVRDVAVNAARVQKTVMDQMQRFPASSKDMTDTMYNIFSSMNVTFGQGAKLLEVFNRAFEAGGMRGSLLGVSDALITLGNNWGISGGNMAGWNRIANNTMATIRFGRLDIEKYTATMNQLAPAFHGAHQSISEMNTAIGFLTRVIPSSRVSAAGLARLMEQLARLAGPLKEKTGVAITDVTGNLLPLSRIIDILAEKFPKLATSGVFLQNFFKAYGGTQGTIQARRALQGLILNRDAYHKTAQDIQRDTRELARSQEALARAPQVQFRIFLNQLKVIEYEIGAAMIPVFEHLGKVIKVVTDYWNGLSKGTKDTIVQFVGYGAAAAIILGILTSMLGLLLAAIGIWKNFGKTIGEVTRLFRPFRGGLRGAGLARGAGEVGLIATRFNEWAAAITILLALLPRFHANAGRLFDLLGGFKTVLNVVNGLFLMFGLRMIAARLVLAGFLSRILIFIGALGGMEIVIGVVAAAIVSNWVRKIPGWNEAFDDFGAHIYNALHPKVPEPKFGATAAEVVKQVRDIESFVKQRETKGIFGKELVAEVQIKFQIPQKGVAQAWVNTVNSLIAKAAPHDLPLGPGVQAAYPSTASVERAMNAWKVKYNAFKATAVDMERELVRLQRAFEIAPTPRLAQRIETLNTAIGKLPKATQTYIEQLAKMWGDVRIVSNRDALVMARNVDRLRRAYERTPSTRGWQLWFAANKQFTTLATQDQQTFANDMVQMNQQAVQKIQQQFQSTLQFIRGLYNQFFGEMQAAFGQLGQGPVFTGLTNRVQQIRDQGTKAAQALRDQADKIEQGAKDAERKISATEGNLIDWGLMLDPSKMKGNTDAVVKSLRDRADAIEKASKARADRLQKRLDEHRLTPTELVRDQQAQLRRFQRWQRHLQQLAARGMPAAMLNALRALGPDFDNMLKSILKMTPAQFRQYTRDFTRAQRIIQNAALKEVRDKLKEYRAYGRNIPQAIAAGIIDEAPAVTRALRQLTRETMGRPTMQRLRRLRQEERATHQNTIHVRLNTTALGNNTTELKRNTAALGKQKDTPTRRTQVHHAHTHVHVRAPRGRRGMTPGQIVRALHDNTRHIRTHTGRVQHNSTRVQHNSGILRQHGTRVQHNSRRLDMWGRAVHNNSTHIQHHSTRLRHNTSNLISLTTAVKDNTKALQGSGPRRRRTRITHRLPRQVHRHNVVLRDPRRHQNPPQHVEHNNYHYHADRSHHMSYEQWLRKQHFLHRNQRRC